MRRSARAPKRARSAARRLTPALLALVPALALTACSGGDGDGNQGPQIEANQTVLRAFDSCEGLTEYFRDEARATLAAQGAYGWNEGPAFDDAIGAPSAGGDPEAGGDGQGNGGGERGEENSGTNNQEAGVDEPDLVKTDGTYLYVARGADVFIYRAADLQPLSRLGVAGGQAQIVIDGDRMGLIYQTWGSAEAVLGGPVQNAPERLAQTSLTAFEIYDVADRAAPRLLKRSLVEGNLVAARLLDGTVRAVVQFDGSGALYNRIYAGGGFGGGGDGGVGRPPVSEGGTGSSGGDSGGDEDRPEPIEPSPVPEGERFAQRRQAQAADWQAAAEQAIAESTLTDWVPYRVDQIEGRAEATPVTGCQQFHRPGEAAGFGVTAVISLNLRDPGAAYADPAVVTGAGVVYVSPQALYLTTTNHARWGWGAAGGPDVSFPGGDVAVGGDTAAVGGSDGDGGGAAIDRREDGQSAEPVAPDEVIEDPADQPDPEPVARPEPEREATQIHKLSLAGGDASPAYVGSGRVFGSPLNQFSLGEHADHLRIATTETRVTDWQTTNHLFVVGAGGDTGLEVVGQVTDLAETERIYAVRFMGPLGFMVTFRQVDPLFTFDLSDPRAPQMLGELKIPGFSTYLHPLDAGHLIGIGQSADEEGRITGMQLSLFDVSDLANPVQSHVQSLGEGYSEALYNHLAFTFYAPRSLLAVPVQRWSDNNGEYREETGVELYDVSTEAGFALRGFVSQSNEDGYKAPISRSMIIGDGLYTFSYAGISAHGLDDLAPRGAASFPPEAGGDHGGREPGQPGMEAPGFDGGEAEPTPALPPEAGGASSPRVAAEPGRGPHLNAPEGTQSAGAGAILGAMMRPPRRRQS